MNQPGLAAQSNAKPYVQSLMYILHCKNLDTLLCRKPLMYFKRAVEKMCSTLT